MAIDSIRGKILKESLNIISTQGEKSLSMRLIAQKLKISHQAPYKHFKNKEEILAELGAMGFKKFYEYLNQELPEISKTKNLSKRLEKMGKNFFQFGLENPNLYKFIFSEFTLPPGENPPDIAYWSAQAFGTLTSQLEAMNKNKKISRNDFFNSAIYLFSSLHGFTGLYINNNLQYLASAENQNPKLLFPIFLKQLIHSI
jgi:AcrR family transcriptional regulator